MRYRSMIQSDRNIVTPLRGLAFFLVLVVTYFAFDAWVLSGTRIIAVKRINHAHAGPSNRTDDTVEDSNGVRFTVRGARYPILGGQTADEIWGVLKAGCRYEIAYYSYSSFARAAFPRDRVAISDAKLLDCPKQG